MEETIRKAMEEELKTRGLTLPVKVRVGYTCMVDAPDVGLSKEDKQKVFAAELAVMTRIKAPIDFQLID